MYQLPRQFSETNGSITDLMLKIVPKEFRNRGLKLVADNYFTTIEVLKNYQEQDISILGTVRPIRIQRFFDKGARVRKFDFFHLYHINTNQNPKMVQTTIGL